MNWNLDEKPLLVFWETTKACDLACKHCRAEAIKQALPNELSHEQGLRLIDQVVAFGRPYPVLILTGGDVLRRTGIFELISYARQQGIHVAVSPSVTPLLTEDAVDRFAAAGVSAMSLSLDGACAKTHDELRGMAGSFERTLSIAAYAVEAGLNVQINTAVMRSNLLELPSIFQAIHDIKVDVWEVFFLIRVGRGLDHVEPTPEECESVCLFLYEASQYGITVRTVEAPFFRRIVEERGQGGTPADNDLTCYLLKELHERVPGPRQTPHARSANTRDGRGIVFVAHDGEVTPSGFLPVSVGNVQERSLQDCYQNSILMRRLRQSDGLGGRCRRCGFRDICGGSRARAYATTGDIMAEDPACKYQARRLSKHTRAY